MGKKVLYSDIINEVKDRLNCTRDDARRHLDAISASIGACLAKGQGLQIHGLGTFRIKVRKATIKRIHGTVFPIPERPYVTFLPVPEVVKSLERMLVESGEDAWPATTPPAPREDQSAPE